MPMPQIDTSATVNIPHADKIVHFGLFFLFSLFAYSWLRGKKRGHGFWNILTVLLLVAIYGGGIEWVQGKFFQRTADIWDWLADMLGGIFGVLSYPYLHYFKQKIVLRIRRRFAQKRR